MTKNGVGMYDEDDEKLGSSSEWRIYTVGGSSRVLGKQDLHI